MKIPKSIKYLSMGTYICNKDKKCTFVTLGRVRNPFCILYRLNIKADTELLQVNYL